MISDPRLVNNKFEVQNSAGGFDTDTILTSSDSDHT
jgi:hypothetical protein